MRYYVALTIASLKIYFREPAAIFWSFFFPVLILVIFGNINFGGPSTITLGLVDQANNSASQGLKTALTSVTNSTTPLFELRDNSTVAELTGLVEDGNVDGLLVIPSDFGASRPATLQLTLDGNDIIQAEITRATLQGVLDGYFEQLVAIPAEYQVANFVTFDVTFADRAGGVDFTRLLVPAVVAMAIMQTAVFGSVFTLVRYKAQGTLRRLQATPSGPLPLLVGESLSSVIVIVVQTFVLLLLGLALFQVPIAPGGGPLAWLSILLISFLGGMLFLGLGLLISGHFRSEKVAAPLANLVTLPMLFLSGVFFPRSFFPDAVQVVAEYLPLTFLIDALRVVTVNGGTVVDVWQEVVGILVWLVILFAVAVRLFRWE